MLLAQFDECMMQSFFMCKKIFRFYDATPGDSWRDWLRTGVPGGVMLAAYAPEGAMKALID